MIPVPFAESTGPVDLFLGLPAHPLIVHVVVVLLPLSAAGLIGIVCVARLRRPFGVLVLAGLLVGAVASVLAEASGEALAARVGWPGEHANLGDRLPPVAIALFLVALAWFLLQRRQDAVTRGQGSGRFTVVMVVLAVLACVLAVAATVLTVLVGHSGASAAWADRMSGPADVDFGSELTMSQVAQHDSAQDCWSVVRGNVYDLTTWIQDHPGGAGSIEAMCGVDATDAFVAMHGSEQVPAESLNWFVLGPLASAGAVDGAVTQP